MTDYSYYGSYDVMLRGVQHANPMFDYMTTFIPRKLKSFFLYCEYLYYYCPQVFAGVRKLAYYPVTALKYDVANSDEKERHRHLHEDVLDTRVHLVQAGIDRQVYGNSFISIHFPFVRFLTCPKCSEKYNTAHTSFKYEWKSVEFQATCDCGYSGKMEVSDEPTKKVENIHIIRWDPKQMDINANPITGEAEYYFSIPMTLSKPIQEGDVFLIRTTPMGFLKTIANQEKMLFKFDPGAIYHMREMAPAGVDRHWGFPPLISAIKSFFNIALLKKANEAIGLDYIVPFRVLSPKQSTAASDPTITISLANWVNEMKANLRAWRRDPLHMMFSPLPTDVTHVGGQGRALLVTGEITEAENAIIAGMGVPREFIYGGLSATGSGVTLRMIENQLLNSSKELVKLAQWIDDQCGKFLEMRHVKLGLEDPKLVDDVQQKMVLLQANIQTGGHLFSETDISSVFGKELKKTRAQRKQEALDEAHMQMELQMETERLRNTLSQRANQAAQAGQPQPYDQQAIIAQANMIVEQLMQVPAGNRRSELDALKAEDAVMYAVVIQQLEQAQNNLRMEAQAQIQSQGSGMP